MPFSSTRGKLARNGLILAAILVVLAATLFALSVAREDTRLHGQYARALDLAVHSIDAQQAAARVYHDLSRVASRSAGAAPTGGPLQADLQKLSESLEALAAELAQLRAVGAESMPGKGLPRAAESTARLLALAREWQEPKAAADPTELRSRLIAASEVEFETIDNALGELLAERRARIDDAASREVRADYIAHVSVFVVGALGLALGLVLTLVAWRSMSINAALMRQLSQLAREDSLTGVANRRTLDERLPQEMARASRQQYALTVVMIDLDHFKRFNDRRGHAAGDALLRNAAQMWLRQLRPSDLLARYGGEEFTLVLPACDETQAERTVERLQPLTPEKQTFSAGIATWNGLDGARELLAAADQALLLAKKSGRNRIIVAGREPQISLPLRLAS